MENQNILRLPGWLSWLKRRSHINPVVTYDHMRNVKRSEGREFDPHSGQPSTFLNLAVEFFSFIFLPLVLHFVLRSDDFDYIRGVGGGGREGGKGGILNREEEEQD